MDFIMNGNSSKKVNFNQHICKKVYYKYADKTDLIFEEIEKKYTILNNSTLAFKDYAQIVRPTEDFGKVSFTGILECSVGHDSDIFTANILTMIINETEITFSLSNGAVVKYHEVNGEYRFDYIPADGEAVWSGSPTITAIDGDVSFTNEGAYNWILDNSTFNIAKGSYAFTNVNLNITNGDASVSGFYISTDKCYNLSINSIDFQVFDHTAIGTGMRYLISFSQSNTGPYVRYEKSGTAAGKWEYSNDGATWTACTVPVITLLNNLTVTKEIGEWFLNSGKTSVDMKDMGIKNYDSTKAIFKIVGVSFSLTSALSDLWYDDAFISNGITYDRMLIATNNTISYIDVNDSGSTSTVVYNINGLPPDGTFWLSADSTGNSPYQTVTLVLPNSVSADFLGWWIPNTTYISS